jgi:chlorite dismutase
LGGWLAYACNGVWFLSTFKPGDAMISSITGFERLMISQNKEITRLRALVGYQSEQLDRLNELYAQDMEQPTPNQSGTISITVNKKLEADIDLLWQVNSADIEALEDSKATFEILKNKAPLKYQSMIYQSLALISKALDMSHSDAFQRIIDKARGDK